MRVAGLISGTSVDGIDVAIVDITGLGPRTRLRLEAFRTVPYPPRVRRALLAACNARSIPVAEISQLNFLVGELFGRAVETTCRAAGIPLRSIELVGSHGQTIYHQGRKSAEHGFRMASTLQIGEPALIAERTSAIAVADFRTADMAAGGQGAPLVPFMDYILYRHPRRGRVALNIGGIANATLIPPAAKPEQVVALDTGPGNMVLDALAERFSGGRQHFDRGGRMALAGRVSPALLRRLLAHPLLRQPAPRTFGREEFGREFVERLLAKQRKLRLRDQDLMATAAALTADSIAGAIRRFARGPMHDLVISGGGAHNRFLVERLRSQTGLRLTTAEDFGIPGDAKEAILFAILAYHTFRKAPSNIPSATGASHPAVLGKVVYPRDGS
jgi:anhydro-N-acetylmuramic acid kinase